jgi:hypothetical protein
MEVTKSVSDERRSGSGSNIASRRLISEARTGGGPREGAATIPRGLTTGNARAHLAHHAGVMEFRKEDSRTARQTSTGIHVRGDTDEPTKVSERAETSDAGRASLAKRTYPSGCFESRTTDATAPATREGSIPSHAISSPAR